MPCPYKIIFGRDTALPSPLYYSGATVLIFNWFPGSAWEPMSRGSASLAAANRKLEAEPPDLCYQALPGNE